MLSQKSLSYLVANIVLILSVTADYSWADMDQREKVTFPELGLLEIHAVASDGKLPIVKVLNTKKKVMLETELGRADRSDSFKYDAGIEFMIRHEKGLPDPLVVVVAAGQHGTSSAWDIAIIGVVSGEVKVLWQQPTILWSEGGFYFGDIRVKRGEGIAVWDVVFDKNESHVSPHRYSMSLFLWNKDKGEFIKGTQLITKHKYESDDEAINEFGFHFKDQRQEFKQLDKFW